jgi:CheY-like chemotaxis protein
MDTRKKILIADDDASNLEFFQVMLSNLGFIVEQAGDGIEALEKVNKFHPDLIILDNIMPGMSGWEVTKVLKSDPKFKQIPIIMLSALDDVKDKVAGFDAGVDDYITKPFNFTEVLARINAGLRNRQLFSQIELRETRLALAEELSKDLKEKLSIFAGSIDELGKAIAEISQNAGANGEKFKSVNEKIHSVRGHIDVLDARIEKTINEWDNLKKGEIRLSVLESQIRKFLQQEQAE